MPGAQWRPALLAEGVKRPRDGQGVFGPSRPRTRSSGLWSCAVSFQASSGSAPTAARLRPSSARICGGGCRLRRGWGYCGPRAGPAPACPQSPRSLGQEARVGVFMGGEREQGSWEGDTAASPVRANGLRLHLDRTELPRAILEHGGVDSVWKRSFPSPAPPHGQVVPAGGGRDQGCRGPPGNHPPRPVCPLLRWEG